MARKLPPIFVKPWTHPIPTSITFFSLKKISLKEENLLLFKIRIEEKTKSTPTKNLKSIKYFKFKAISKNNIKNGKQNKLYSWMNFLSLIFDLKNCIKLIDIETGIRIFIVLAKSYPNINNVGVPNSKSPTPKIDWTIIKKTITINSIKEFVITENLYHLKVVIRV